MFATNALAITRNYYWKFFFFYIVFVYLDLFFFHYHHFRLKMTTQCNISITYIQITKRVFSKILPIVKCIAKAKLFLVFLLDYFPFTLIERDRGERERETHCICILVIRTCLNSKRFHFPFQQECFDIQCVRGWLRRLCAIDLKNSLQTFLNQKKNLSLYSGYAIFLNFLPLPRISPFKWQVTGYQISSMWWFLFFPNQSNFQNWKITAKYNGVL